jgi:hypothetical protein
MEAEADQEYISFLSNLRVCDDSFMLEIKPDGASPPVRVKYEELNPTCGMKPDRKRTRGDLSEIDSVMEESDGESPGLEPDLVRSGKKKENKEEGLSKRNLGFREMDESVKIDGEEIAPEIENASVEDEREVPQQAALQPETLSTHVRHFFLLLL